MKKSVILGCALAAAVGCAQASVIQVEAANGSSGFLADAAAYQAAVDATLLNPSYAMATPASLDFISHNGLFGGATNFAMKTTVSFGVASAGTWSFRAGVDFGFGGAMFLDGVAVDFKANDMWWAGNYDNASQFLAASGPLTAGNHVLTVMGFEACCDGGQQVQFMKSGDTVFTSFSTTDGLVAEVPEPATFGLAAAGLALVGLGRRRKVRQA
ncbi:MAG: CCXG family PEP-CTERM protein [Pseudomonadota bacterium]